MSILQGITRRSSDMAPLMRLDWTTDGTGESPTTRAQVRARSHGVLRGLQPHLLLSFTSPLVYIDCRFAVPRVCRDSPEDSSRPSVFCNVSAPNHGIFLFLDGSLACAPPVGMTCSPITCSPVVCCGSRGGSTQEMAAWPCRWPIMLRRAATTAKPPTSSHVRYRYCPTTWMDTTSARRCSRSSAAGSARGCGTHRPDLPHIGYNMLMTC